MVINDNKERRNKTWELGRSSRNADDLCSLILFHIKIRSIRSLTDDSNITNIRIVIN